MNTKPNYYFIFDVESIGLHGEGFAVAGGIYKEGGNAIREFTYACPPLNATGNREDRDWVHANVVSIPPTHNYPNEVRQAFWTEWLNAKNKFNGIQMYVECGWPVEARFLNLCVDDSKDSRNWQGPYPLHEIASVMLAAGMDPMATYDRQFKELPAHHPLADARLSARLFFEAKNKIVSL